MRTRIVVLTLMSAGLALGAASVARLQPKGPVVYMEGDRIQVRGTGRYMIVTVAEKDTRRIFAYELGPALICRLGEPCEPCQRGGCVEPPPPIVNPGTCPPNSPKPCIEGAYGSSGAR
jgi:hypothetical protein